MVSSILNKEDSFFIQPVANIIPAICSALKYSRYIQKLYGGGSYKNTLVYPYKRDDSDLASLPTICIFHSGLNSPDFYYGYEGTVSVIIFDSIKNTRSNTADSIDNKLSVLVDTFQNPNFLYATEQFLVNYNENKSIPGFIEAKNKYGIIDRLGIDLDVDFGYNINLISIGDCWKSTIKFKYLLSKEAYRYLLRDLGIEIYSDPNLTTYYPLWNEIEVDIEEQKSNGTKL